MAVKSGFFMSVNGDRRYDASFFAEYFSSFIGNGIFPNPSTNLQVVEGNNMQTVVKPGKGWINGYYVHNDSDFILQHDVADGVLKRIDRVVLQWNYLTRQIVIVLKKGALASSPAAPALVRNTDYYELALADVLISNGITRITQAAITDQRLNSALCGVVTQTVKTVDTTTLFNQYQSWFNTTKNNAELELQDFQTTLENSMTQWMQQEQNDFEMWFATIQNILDENVAATLTAKVANLEQTTEDLNDTVTEHLAKNASTTQSGHVQLSNDTNSTSEMLAPTMKALNEVKLLANDIKVKWASVVGSPLVSTDTQAQLQSKTQTIKNTLATNLTVKGQPSSGTDNLVTLVDKVSNISTGKKYASGSSLVSSSTLNFTTDYGSSTTRNFLNVTGLSFAPSFILVITNNVRNGLRDFIVYNNKKVFYESNSTTSIANVIGSSGYLSFRLTGNAYVNSTGFQLPVTASGNVDWYAFE